MVGRMNFLNILDQEKLGMDQFVKNNMLPIECPRENLEKLGFEFLKPVDDIFIDCTFPKGWGKLRLEDNDMWCELRDEKLRTRGKIFFKTSLHDRNSHMNLERKISIDWEYIDNDRCRAFVKNEYSYNKLFTTKIIDRKDEDYSSQRWHLEELCSEFMAENFPDNLDPMAYWEAEAGRLLRDKIDNG